MRTAYLNTRLMMLIGVTVFCLEGGDRSAADDSQAEDHMILNNFNTRTIPRNRAGDTYASVYAGEGSAGTVSLNSTDAVNGNSLQADITAKGLYLQFNPYDRATRGFARDYVANPAGWRFNTYNRMSFWIKRPSSASPLGTGGPGERRVRRPTSRGSTTPMPTPTRPEAATTTMSSTYPTMACGHTSSSTCTRTTTAVKRRARTQVICPIRRVKRSSTTSMP